jgi:hypothetical protein
MIIASGYDCYAVFDQNRADFCLFFFDETSESSVADRFFFFFLDPPPSTKSLTSAAAPLDSEAFFPCFNFFFNAATSISIVELDFAPPA